MVEIRTYEEKDSDKCIDILRKTLLPCDVDHLINDLKEEYEYKRYVCVYDNQVIALGGYYRPNDADYEYEKYLLNFENYVCLDWGAVLPEYQNLGIGKKMFLHCENDAKSRGYTHMAVWTVVPDYFKKLGYEYLKDYDYSEDEMFESYLMLKEIK